MKKVLFSMAAAIFTVAGLSSFRTHNFKTIYWFKVWTNYAKGVLPSNVNPSEVTYSSSGGSKPYTSPCSGGASYICLIGFTLQQLTAIHNTHLLPGGQIAQTSAYTKN